VCECVCACVRVCVCVCVKCVHTCKCERSVESRAGHEHWQPMVLQAGWDAPGVLSRDTDEVLAAEGVATPCDDPAAPEREVGVPHLAVDDPLLLLREHNQL